MARLEKYSEKQKQIILDKICNRIMQGERLNIICNEKEFPDRVTVYKWLGGNKEFVNQYARAMEVRADVIFDKLVDIAENKGEDHTPFTGGNVVQRDRLRADIYKWMLSKMNPKKYSDKIDITSAGNSLGNKNTVINFKDFSGKIKDLKKKK
jgi:hypothetical protein